MQLVRSKYANVTTMVNGQLVDFREHKAVVDDAIAEELTKRSGDYTISDRFGYRTAKNILIVRGGGIGDLVMCTVVPKFIKAVNPGCRITWSCFHGMKRVLENNPHVDEVVEGIVPFLGWDKYDFVVNLQGFFEDPSGSAANWNRQYEVHRVDMLRQQMLVIEYANPDTPKWSNEAFFKVEPHELEAAKNALKDMPKNRRLMALVTKASEQTRRHPNNPGIAQHFVAKGWNVVVLSPGGAEDEAIKGDGILNTTGKIDLGTMAAFIQASDVVVSPDTGPLHIAGALGKKIVTFFNSFPPHTRVAYYKNCHAFYPRDKCPRMPCGYAHCPAHCFEEITPEMIHEKAAEMTADWGK